MPMTAGIDPIVEEVRAARRVIAEEAGNDLHALCEMAREWEREHPGRIGTSNAAPNERLSPEVPTKESQD